MLRQCPVILRAERIAGSCSESFMLHLYAPTATQKSSGFTIKIEGLVVVSGEDHVGYAKHIYTEVWGQ